MCLNHLHSHSQNLDHLHRAEDIITILGEELTVLSRPTRLKIFEILDVISRNFLDDFLDLLVRQILYVVTLASPLLFG